MGDFLRFETMITPLVIQVVFWIAVVVSVIAGIITLFQGGWSILAGILIIIFGPLLARIYCEIIMVFFRINEHLRAIQHNTQRV